MGHSRSQRHMREIRGYDSNGLRRPGFVPPAIGTISPASAGLTAAGAVGRTIGTFTVTGGTAPFTWTIPAAAGVSAAFSGNALNTTVNPCGTVAIHTMTLRVSDARGVVKDFSFPLTLS